MYLHGMQATVSGRRAHSLYIVQGQYTMIINNLQEYFNGSLASSFWQNQFVQDVHGIMDTATDNGATALALQGAYDSFDRV